jgi:snRNA-activating protein complex subunit 3
VHHISLWTHPLFLQQTKVQHFLVLASQKLSELREKIVCPNDYLCSEDLSDSPSAREELVQERPTNRSESAFFFINNTFYNDMRHPQAVNVSE